MCTNRQKKLPEDISKKIDKLFVHDDDRKEANNLLTDIFNRNWNVGSDQLTRSLLVLSEGKISLLKMELNFDDPRDVIMKAEEHEGNPQHYFINPFKE